MDSIYIIKKKPIGYIAINNSLRVRSPLIKNENKNENQKKKTGQKDNKLFDSILLNEYYIIY